MTQRFTLQVKDRVLAKLGGPAIDVELDDKQIEELYTNAVKDWYLYSTLSKIEKYKVEEIKGDWTENYFQALCKEALGRIRGKFRNGLAIPGAEGVMLDFESLLNEAEKEKDGLIGLLVPPAEKIVLAVYINVGNMDFKDVKPFMEKIQRSVGEDKAYKYFFIPVRDQESKVECVYPNFLSDETIKEKLNVCLDDVIKSIKNEQ